MKAEEMFTMIKELENEERINLLNLLFDEYYNTGIHPKAEIEMDEN